MRTVTVILLTAMLSGALAAQKPAADDSAAKRELERKVKTSGDYYYGEATADNAATAASQAKMELAQSLNLEALINDPSAQTLQVNDLEAFIKTIELKRGEKFRIIAYMERSKLNEARKNGQQQASSSKQAAAAVADAVQASQSAESQPHAASGKNAETKTQQQPTDVAGNDNDKLDAFVEPAEFIVLDTDSPDTKPTVNYGGLLDSVVRANNMYEVLLLLNSYKRKGRTTYSYKLELLSDEQLMFKTYIIRSTKNGEIKLIAELRDDRLFCLRSNRDTDAITTDMVTKQLEGQRRSDLSAAPDELLLWFQLY